MGGREEGREDGEGVRDKKAEEGREKVSLLLQWNTGFSIKSGSSSPLHIRSFQSYRAVSGAVLWLYGNVHPRPTHSDEAIR